MRNQEPRNIVHDTCPSCGQSVLVEVSSCCYASKVILNHSCADIFPPVGVGYESDHMDDLIDALMKKEAQMVESVPSYPKYRRPIVGRVEQ